MYGTNKWRGLGAGPQTQESACSVSGEGEFKLQQQSFIPHSPGRMNPNTLQLDLPELWTCWEAGTHRALGKESGCPWWPGPLDRKRVLQGAADCLNVWPALLTVFQGCLGLVLV